MPLHHSQSIKKRMTDKDLLCMLVRCRQTQERTFSLYCIFRGMYKETTGVELNLLRANAA
jgi:hypothetical protein